MFVSLPHILSIFLSITDSCIHTHARAQLTHTHTHTYTHKNAEKNYKKLLKQY